MRQAKDCHTRVAAVNFDEPTVMPNGRDAPMT